MRSMIDPGVALRVGTGWSDLEDAADAATEAATRALEGRHPSPGDLVVLMAGIEHDPEVMVRTVRRLADPAQVVGCSANAAFATGAHQPRRCVVLHVPAGQLAIGVGSAVGAKRDLHAAARDACRAARSAAEKRAASDGVERPHAALLVLADGLAGDQREVVRGAYEVAGAAVPLVGGAAGEDLSFRGTWQAVDGAVVEDGVVAVWLASPEPLGVGVDHGWQPVSRQLQVTRATGNRIVELDGRPALEVYLEVRDEPTRAGGQSFASQVLDRPLGLPNEQGGYDVRHIADQSPEGLTMFGHVHDQAIVRLLAADRAGLHDGARRAVLAATAQLGRPTRGAIVFSCTARYAVLGDGIDDEIIAIEAALGGAPAGGFYTYGEFARVTGSTGFHNASVAVLAL